MSARPAQRSVWHMLSVDFGGGMKRRLGWVTLVGAVWLLFAAASAAGETRPLPARLFALTPATDFIATTNGFGETVLESVPVFPPAGWDELVVSWNAGTNLTLVVEAQAGWTNGQASRPFPLGTWSANGTRTSPKPVKDHDGEVETDILRLNRPAVGARVRLTLQGPREELKRVFLAFLNRRMGAPDRSPERSAWGKVLAVPVRTQAEFPEGIDKWCSPTCTSMLLEFWSKELSRPELNITVPLTAQAVFDPGWGGTGNWPFNTAFAGSFSGLRSCVSRFNDLTDLERWVGSGLPVAASISYSLLKGREQPEKGDGHLVVVSGFTAEGDVAINDPGVRRARVQWVVPRAHFLKAWSQSQRTVYLVWPEERPTPGGECFP